MDYNELQNRVYQNAQMGISALRQVIPAVKNQDLKNVLVNQYRGYKEQSELTAKQMKSKNQTPQSVPFYEKMMAKAAASAKLSRDNSSENIAKLLIKGTNTGIIELNQTLNRTSKKNNEAVRSAKEYLKKEQEYIDSLKPFL